MSSNHGRTGSRIEGSATTSRQLKDLARRYLVHLEQKLQFRPREVLELWPQVIAPQFVAMTRAVKFEEGVLHVRVSNSSLLSLLHGASEKKRLIEALKAKISGVEINDISFRIGSLSEGAS